MACKSYIFTTNPISFVYVLVCLHVRGGVVHMCAQVYGGQWPALMSFLRSRPWFCISFIRVLCLCVHM